VLLDTNLLVLLIVGRVDRARLGQHKRLKEYAEDDFALLEEMLSKYSEHVSMPNILTETSNLLNIGEKRGDARIAGAFSRYCESLLEIFVPTRMVASTAEFRRFGLTDAAIMLSGDKEFTLLTSDWPLYGMMQSQGSPAVNFWNAKVL
jgi:hypothetical protein